MNAEKSVKAYSDIEGNDKEDSTRREFFERFGKVALYTPPAVFLLMNAQNTEAVVGSCSGFSNSRRCFGDQPEPNPSRERPIGSPRPGGRRLR